MEKKINIRARREIGNLINSNKVHADKVVMDLNSIARAMEAMIDDGASTYDVLRLAVHFRRQEMEATLFSHLNGFVDDGPFKGMSYLPYSHGSTLLPKLLGSYEKELQEDITQIASTVENFLDIGCAEGYYTTGIALMPGIKRVYGVDINREALESASAMAGLNSVGHKCSFFENIEEALSDITGKTMILIDVDGNEVETISRLGSSMDGIILRNAKIIVETDFTSDRRKYSNKAQIIEAMNKIGFIPIKEIYQDPTKRISKAARKYTESFMDLVIQGFEGRRLNQSWILFNCKS